MNSSGSAEGKVLGNGHVETVTSSDSCSDDDEGTKIISEDDHFDDCLSSSSVRRSSTQSTHSRKVSEEEEDGGNRLDVLMAKITALEEQRKIDRDHIEQLERNRQTESDRVEALANQLHTLVTAEKTKQSTLDNIIQKQQLITHSHEQLTSKHESILQQMSNMVEEHEKVNEKLSAENESLKSELYSLKGSTKNKLKKLEKDVNTVVDNATLTECATESLKKNYSESADQVSKLKKLIEANLRSHASAQSIVKDQVSLITKHVCMAMRQYTARRITENNALIDKTLRSRIPAYAESSDSFVLVREHSTNSGDVAAVDIEPVSKSPSLSSSSTSGSHSDEPVSEEDEKEKEKEKESSKVPSSAS